MTIRRISYADPATTANSIMADGLIAVLRATTAEHFPAIAEVLLEAGIRNLEVTLTATDALDAIARLNQHFGDDVNIGAGTVVTTAQAVACVAAGAAFLVSPTVCPGVVAVALEAGVAVYPGAMTPTEMLAAAQAGATAVKLFPASAVSPSFIADVHGPFPDIAIVPTGGIALADIAAWIGAGAAAVGLGTPLIGVAAKSGVDHGLAGRARQAVDAVAQGRST